MATLIVELDTYTDRARRAADRRKKAKAAQRRSRPTGSKGRRLDVVPELKSYDLRTSRQHPKVEATQDST